MISAIFIRRPRLAVVVAIVVTLAGAIAMTRIPVAQFPDIVPPRVQVTAIYPGASAAVIEAAVAQPLEAQIVGVDKMIYMKSTSGNDGSYNLTVSLRGRHQSRHRHGERQQPGADGAAAAAAGRAAAGPDGDQALGRDPAVHESLQRDRQAFAGLHHQLRHHQRARRAGRACPASARRCCSASSTIRCASGSTPSGWPASTSRRPTSCRPSRRRTCRRRSAASARGRSPTTSSSSSTCRHRAR